MSTRHVVVASAGAGISQRPSCSSFNEILTNFVSLQEREVAIQVNETQDDEPIRKKEDANVNSVGIFYNTAFRSSKNHCQAAGNHCQSRETVGKFRVRDGNFRIPI
jgi:hypothetical protein